METAHALIDRLFFNPKRYDLGRVGRYRMNRKLNMDVPDDVIKRLQGVDKSKQADEGIKMACEQIEEFKEMKGVHGIHLMAIEWEHMVPEIAERAKVLPRPTV